jgi:hypothetical protein
LLLLLFYTAAVFSIGLGYRFLVRTAALRTSLTPACLIGSFATPLCIYIACKLTQWRKIALLCAAALQAVYDGVAGIINLANGLVLDVNRTGIAF